MRTITPALALLALLLLALPILAEEAPEKPKTKSLFDGKSLEHFEVPQFGGEGAVEVKDGVITMGQGAMLTGITYKRDDFPKTNYELTWEARRTMGIDFFAAATFPVKDSHCSFIPGGWGGAVVGLSNINGEDASENETTTYIAFKDDQWYQFKVRVTDKKIEAWIDEKKVIDAKIEGKKISTRNEVDLSHPMGFAAWQSSAEIRKIELRVLGE
ncbi:hypothetical protein Pan97_42470 [Bremerella volcania]|uniref:3-keto-alpha-glucoside-1,2-lyase/3-keto-2-hydroxy-glucal hydratase domain-containing protein n=1 Tax=Bremerella volcania TaxID=2527984 RepID=A0A518CD79_9BACT|nr:DUF1080 domain-containing protein [Bremerella volcania]QDU77185.1 hypothetical protein Pan97_42470 [Bremerella volcania]